MLKEHEVCTHARLDAPAIREAEQFRAAPCGADDRLAGREAAMPHCECDRRRHREARRASWVVVRCDSEPPARVEAAAGVEAAVLELIDELRRSYGAALLGLADTLTELKTICHCGRKATMNLRVGPDGRAVREGAQVEIGGNDRYVAMCRRHFKEALANAG